jgi:hypothetical protein
MPLYRHYRVIANFSCRSSGVAKLASAKPFKWRHFFERAGENFPNKVQISVKTPTDGHKLLPV